MSEILINFMGRFANQVIQYMTAKSIQIESGENFKIKFSKAIDQVQLSEGQHIDNKPIEGNEIIRVSSNTFNTIDLVNRIKEGNVSIILSSYCARASYFNKYAQIFQKIINPLNEFSYEGFGEDYLVIHVRLGDIISGDPHPWYKPLPLNYYDHLISTTKLKPVFIGEFCDHFYSNALKLKFKNAIFIDSNNSTIIFNILSRSVNVVLAISTFSWLATFLSSNTKRIFYPISGILNPLGFNDGADFQHNFINRLDDRVIYHKFSDDVYTGSFQELSDMVIGASYFEEYSDEQISNLLKIADERLPRKY